MIEIGDYYRFVPAANTDHSSGFPDQLQVKVTGTVVFIHEEHRWFRVAWKAGGTMQHECFPLPVAAEEPDPARAAYRRCFDGGARQMGQAYGLRSAN